VCNRHRALRLIVAGSLLAGGSAQGQSPWYARDRWQLELSTGSVIFECQLKERSGDSLIVTESDSLRRVPLTMLTGMRLLRPAAKTVARQHPHS
jgi:hypothetical protein